MRVYLFTYSRCNNDINVNVTIIVISTESHSGRQHFNDVHELIQA